jgi:signal transduction histidine kinase
VQADYAKMVHESGQHLRSLIEDVLDVSRIERGVLRMVEQEADAADIAEIAAKMCRDNAAAQDIGIVATLTDNLEIAGDVTRIKQVIINLLTNAIKFSGRGGTVELSLDRGADGGAVFAIADNGIGIAAVDMERIFEPFVQADLTTTRRFGGLGLGLPIARSIARMHGGDVTLDSAPGRGTIARFTLPPERVRDITPGPLRAVA